jgi:hypothetical protein
MCISLEAARIVEKAATWQSTGSVRMSMTFRMNVCSTAFCFRITATDRKLADGCGPARSGWIMKTALQSAGRTHDPARQGEFLKSTCTAPLGVTIAQTADAPGRSRKFLAINRLIPISLP